MTTQVVLQPSSNKEAWLHYQDTIESPVALTRIIPYLNSEQLDALPAQIRSRTSIAVWGVRPADDQSNVKKWERIQTGDIALFSRKKKIFASATIIHKLQNKALGLELWKPGKFKEAPFEYLYFLDELIPQNISYEAFNAAAGYKLNNTLQGFSVLDQEKSKNILFEFDLYSSQYYPPISHEEFKSVVREFDPNKPLDATRVSYSRVEQGYLREQMVGGYSELECCICGKNYPVEFIVAAHIKKRSHCSQEERLDFENIVAPMCKFGCDELYERGYISVGSNGVIKASPNLISKGSLLEYITAIEGRNCSYWHPKSETYFSWQFKLFN